MRPSLAVMPTTQLSVKATAESPSRITWRGVQRSAPPSDEVGGGGGGKEGRSCDAAAPAAAEGGERRSAAGWPELLRPECRRLLSPLRRMRCPSVWEWTPHRRERLAPPSHRGPPSHRPPFLLLSALFSLFPFLFRPKTPKRNPLLFKYEPTSGLVLLLFHWGR